jgi:4'-phosphopantetheinyl transferase EntD
MRLLEDLLPPFAAHAACVDTEGLDLTDRLFPEERGHLARAVDKRRREFALGRSCAREAMGALGIAAQALPSLPDRSVGWPDAIWGTITHTDGFCAAAVARRDDTAGLGLDAEVRARVQPRLWSSIATPFEVAWFEEADGALLQAERATRLFSAKESFYKAQYCATRAWVGFHDVELTFDGQGGFEVALMVDVAAGFTRGTRFHGREAFTRDHVLTALWLPR